MLQEVRVSPAIHEARQRIMAGEGTLADLLTVGDGPYIEAQIFGVLRPSETLKAIVVQQRSAKEAIEAKLREKNLTRIRVVQSQIDSELYAVWTMKRRAINSLNVEDIENLGDLYMDKILENIYINIFRESSDAATQAWWRSDEVVEE